MNEHPQTLLEAIRYFSDEVKCVEKELQTKLNALSEEQLTQNVVAADGEMSGFDTVILWEAEEDWIGDGTDTASPRSTYTDQSEADEEDVIFPKGYLLFELSNSTNAR